jgi:hypothetical protein
MSEEELAKFLAVVEQIREANTASPEAARNFLKKSGYLNKDGSIAAHYTTAQSSNHD